MPILARRLLLLLVCGLAACDPVRSSDDADPDAAALDDDGGALVADAALTPDAGLDCGDGVRDPDEDCDKSDLGGLSCASLPGFQAGDLACTASCTFDTAGCIACGDGVAEGDEDCDGTDLGGASCTSIGQGFIGGTLACDPATCRFDTAACTAPPNCPNGMIDPGEQCEGGNLNGGSCSSATGGARPSGTLACTGGCQYDTSSCYKCGDGSIDGAEVCDGTNLGGQTCVSKGHDGGTLTCAGTCLAFVETACSDCGDGTIESPEVCDGTNLGGQSCTTQGAFSGGTLACNGTCSAFSTSGCFGAPTVPVLARPLNGAYVGSAITAGTRRPRFTWRAATVMGGTAIRYDLQYSTDKAFPAGAATTTVANLTTLEHQPTGDLAIQTVAPKGARYFWRVRACAGNACSAYSAPYLVNVGRSDHDFDGDGYADVAVASPAFDNVAGLTSVGRVGVFFGPTPAFGNAELIQGTTANEGPETNLDAGDFNGDGYTDLVLGVTRNDAVAQNAGAVSVYLGGPSFDSTPDWQVFGFAASDRLGEVAVGDVNGDGFDDLIVGTPGYDAGSEADAGRVDVYHGGAAFDTTADRTYLGTSAEAIGYGLGAADLNGDGFADLVSPFCTLLFGACSYTDRVYHGAAGGLPATASRSFQNAAFNESAGDVNADGYEDLLSWLPNCGLGGCTYLVYVVPGAPTGQMLVPVSIPPPSGHMGSYFGGGRDGVGDVNRDGYDDIVIGDYSQPSGGAWWLYLGGAGAFNTTPDLTYSGVGNTGYAICGGGDFNGDGAADWAHGAIGEAPVGGGAVGFLRMFFGSSPSANNVIDASVQGDQGGAELGKACSL